MSEMREDGPKGKGIDPVSRLALLFLLVNLSLVEIKLALSYVSGSGRPRSGCSRPRFKKR